jgi:hypothetical protein
MDENTSTQLIFSFSLEILIAHSMDCLTI